MTRRPRRNHSPAFNAKVALTAIRGEQTLVELSQQFDVHAKIGALALENDFLPGALSKAGLLT